MLKVPYYWLLVACATARLACAGDALLDLAPPDTKAVFGIRLKGIVNSTLFQTAFRTASTGKPELAAQWRQLVAFTGFDPLSDIDEVLIAASGDDQKSSGLVVLRGRFDAKRMTSGAQLYHGIPLAGSGSNGTSVIALLDAATAIAGEKRLVRAAIDRRGHPSTLDASLAARIESSRERFDVWGLGDRPGGFNAPTGGAQDLDAVDRFEVGVRMTNGFEIAAELHSRTARGAQKLAASLGSISTMLAAAGKDSPKLNLQVKDGSVKFSMALSPEELKKMMADLAVTRKASGLPVVSGPPTVTGSDVTGTSAPSAGKAGETTVFVLPGKK